MRIYLAGKITSNNNIDFLNNIKNGIEKTVEIIKDGFFVFSPFLDYQFAFFGELTKEQYQQNSLSWLEVSDEVWVLPNWEESLGTQKEILRANQLNIPVRFL